MQSIRKRLLREFEDSEYANQYMASHTVSTIAAQVYWTRNMRKWTQDDLARESGIAQSRISKIENGDFSSLTMSTLNKLATALDINLRIEFERFSHGIQRVCSESKEKLEIPARMYDLHAAKSVDKVFFQSIPARTGNGLGTPTFTSHAIANDTYLSKRVETKAFPMALGTQILATDVLPVP